MNTLKMILGCACLAAVLNVQPAHAQIVPYSDRSTFDGTFSGANVETWNEYSNLESIPNGTTLNNITYNSSNGSALITGGFLAPTPSGFGNGLGENNVGYFLPSDQITFTFAHPLSAFGIDINTAASDAGDYTATLSNSDVADSSSDPFPGFSTGEFLGFSDATPFSSVTIEGLNSGAGYTLDSLRYLYAAPSSPLIPQTSAVPEPSTVALMFVGLMGIAVLAIRRKLLV